MNVKAFVKKYTMVIALVAVFILFGLLTHGRLFYPQNMSNLMLQNSYVLVLACGMLLCILTGGNIDLSVGSTVCLVGALAAQLMDKNGMNAYLVIFICLMVGAVIGGWQGFWIGYIHIPPFICTLSGMFLFRGLGRVILASKTVPVKDKTFLNIFASYVQIPGLDDNKIEQLRFDPEMPEDLGIPRSRRAFADHDIHGPDSDHTGFADPADGAFFCGSFPLKLPVGKHFDGSFRDKRARCAGCDLAADREDRLSADTDFEGFFYRLGIFHEQAGPKPGAAFI